MTGLVESRECVDTRIDVIDCDLVRTNACTGAPDEREMQAPGVVECSRPPAGGLEGESTAEAERPGHWCLGCRHLRASPAEARCEKGDAIRWYPARHGLDLDYGYGPVGRDCASGHCPYEGEVWRELGRRRPAMATCGADTAREPVPAGAPSTSGTQEGSP